MSSCYQLTDNRIFVFSNEKNIRDLYLTYNVVKDVGNRSKTKNTISIHRKKHTNTLYTLNAMNRLIEDENEGDVASKEILTKLMNQVEFMKNEGYGYGDSEIEIPEMMKCTRKYRLMLYTDLPSNNSFIRCLICPIGDR